MISCTNLGHSSGPRSRAHTCRWVHCEQSLEATQGVTVWCGKQRTLLRPRVSLLQPLGSNHSLQYCDLFWFPSLLKSLTSRYITWLSSSPWRWALSPIVSPGENKLYPQDRDESFQKPWTSLRIVPQPEQIPSGFEQRLLNFIRKLYLWVRTHLSCFLGAALHKLRSKDSGQKFRKLPGAC